MQIMADITRDDYKSFTQHIQRMLTPMPSSKLLLPLWHFANATMWVFLIFLVALLLRMFGIPIDIPTAAVSLLAYYAISFWHQTRLQRKTYLDDNGFILGPKFYIIDENCILEKKDYFESRTQWPAIKSLEETENYFFILMDKSVGHIIPKRCFSSELQREEFSTLLKSRIHRQE
jgi:hypothetical protein